jgi:hypothetical protein
MIAEVIVSTVYRNRGTLDAERERRREDAKVRQAGYNACTPEAILGSLDRAFGVGVGAKRERARLLKRIADRKPEEKVVEAPVAAPVATVPVLGVKTSNKKGVKQKS